MNAEKPNFLSQPEVKNIFFYRNGDPYYEPRRLVVNAKRVSTFETLLREVTGGVRAPFGAVRNIYTPKAGHKIDSLEHLRSGEQYVAAGREKFKKIDYLQIGTRKKRTLQPNGLMKPVPQSRLRVSARFLKPIKEPCAIFIVANGDVLNPAVRLLIPSRVVGQFEHILEMITEKIGLRIVGGVRSLYTFDGTLIMDGKELENGQFYVAVGRDKFKKLPYSDLLFSKPIGIKRVNGSKAASLPPIYKYRRQNGDVGNHVSKSVVSGSECGQDKSSPPAQSSKEQLTSIVREISQAKLMNIRKKRSGLTASHEAQDDDDGEDRSAEDNKFSPEVRSSVKQEAEEAIPDSEQEDKNEAEEVSAVPEQEDKNEAEEVNPDPEQEDKNKAEEASADPELEHKNEAEEANPDPEQEDKNEAEESSPDPEQEDNNEAEEANPDPEQGDKNEAEEANPDPEQENKNEVEEPSPDPQQGDKLKAEEASPDLQQEDNAQEQTNVDGISKTENELDQTTEESSYNEEEEKKQEDENVDGEKIEMEEQVENEDNGDNKGEGETSEPETKGFSEEKKEEEVDAEKTPNEEEKQLEAQEESNEEKPDNKAD